LYQVERSLGILEQKQGSWNIKRSLACLEAMGEDVKAAKRLKVRDLKEKVIKK